MQYWHFFLCKAKAPFLSGASAKIQTYEKETCAFRFTGFLAGVGISTFLEGSLARGGTG
jgi:hypothetical protein